MKKPLIKDYCKPFFLDPGNKELVSFDSKAYSIQASKYIKQLEQQKDILIDALVTAKIGVQSHRNSFEKENSEYLILTDIASTIQKVLNKILK